MLCDQLGPVRPAGSARAAVLAMRGNCSFAAKAIEAARRGYAAVIVLNSVSGIVSSATPNFTSTMPVEQLAAQPCDVDCHSGSAWADASAVTTEQVLQGTACGAAGVSGCGAMPCVPTGQTRNATSSGLQVQLCCASDHATQMQGDTRGEAAAEAFFATLEAGRALSGAAPGAAGLGSRWLPAVDPSAFFSWAVGFGALLLASWYGAEEDRIAQTPAGERPARPVTPAAIDAVPLTVREVALMLVGAALVLSGLFLLIQLGFQIVYLVLLLFAVSGTSALALLVFYPCVHRVTPLARAQCDLPCLGHVTGSGATAAALGAACMLAWFLTRHQSWSWVPQDVVGVLLCALFCRQIRVPSLRLAVAISAVFLVYDVIMVFLTPLLVGSSVMIDVATAGAPVAVIDQGCYCRLNPDDWAVCGAGERMPILFAVPRTSDYRGGFALLGLGDVVIPGLIVTLALRMDVNLAGSVRGSYWLTALGSYAAGLACANVAVVTTGLGQPALLYIMPFVAVGLTVAARCRGELDHVWLFGADSSVQAARRRGPGARARRRGVSAGGGGGGAGRGPGAGDDDDTGAGDAVDGAFAPLREGGGALGGDSEDEEAAPAWSGPAFGESPDGDVDDPAAGDLGGGAGQHWGSVVPEVELSNLGSSLGEGGARGGTA